MQASSYSVAVGDDGALQYGVKWGGLYGTGVNLTFSAPTSNGAFYDGYGSGEPKVLYTLTSVERAALRDALAAWSGPINVTFTEVEDSSAGAGDLRFSRATLNENEAAYGYYPGNYPEGGDIWFNNGVWHAKAGKEIKKGSYDYLTILHEIGHALGLEHPFEGSQKLAKKYDSYAFTVMSYTAASGGNDNYASFYPTTPMHYDLVSIQGIYGRGSHNPDDTTYTYRAGKNYWETIDDTGGVDTIAYKGDGRSIIDLRIGHWSDLGETIHFTSSSTRFTVMIGPGTAIEKVCVGYKR